MRSIGAVVVNEFPAGALQQQNQLLPHARQLVRSAGPQFSPRIKALDAELGEEALVPALGVGLYALQLCLTLVALLDLPLTGCCMLLQCGHLVAYVLDQQPCHADPAEIPPAVRVHHCLPLGRARVCVGAQKCLCLTLRRLSHGLVNLLCSEVRHCLAVLCDERIRGLVRHWLSQGLLELGLQARKQPCVVLRDHSARQQPFRQLGVLHREICAHPPLSPGPAGARAIT
mmetsp:Transcript_108060/g.301319  ORF Transcript_108060/g.301319 Transcript_108060/m.301319 type:complete len:229 (-) Transcript_108060:8-694(-)